MNEIISILEKVSEGLLHQYLDSRSEIDLEIFSSMLNAGYVNAIDASDSEKLVFLEPEITVTGREYLVLNKKELNNATVQEGKNSWYVIEDEYNLSKRSFGRRINLVVYPGIRK